MSFKFLVYTICLCINIKLTVDQLINTKILDSNCVLYLSVHTQIQTAENNSYSVYVHVHVSSGK